MNCYRLIRHKFTQELSGKGAAMYGARWNSKGTEIIYLSDSRSLAMAEVLVHLSLDTLPSDFVMMTITIPEGVPVSDVVPETLPEDWHIFPHSMKTQHIGDEFVLENRFCALRVPSAVVQGDFNILLNPAHPDFHKVRIAEIQPFPFDRRFMFR